MTLITTISSLAWNQDGELSAQDQHDLLQSLFPQGHGMKPVEISNGMLHKQRAHPSCALQGLKSRPSHLLTKGIRQPAWLINR